MAFPNNYPQPFPQMPQAQLPQQQSTGSVTVVSVNGEMGAMTYPVAAGNTGFLFDWGEHMFWVKSTDQNSVPQPLRSFRFEEVTPAPSSPADPNMVTRKEFDELKGELQKIFEAVNKAPAAKEAGK